MTNGESGFSLMEVIVATVIATIAVVGLAYTFGMGRGYINRFEVARAAMGAAEGEIEQIAATPSSDTLVSIGSHMSYFIVDGRIEGSMLWDLSWVDDPVDGTSPSDPNPHDLRQATVTVRFHMGSVPDSIRMWRLLKAS